MPLFLCVAKGVVVIAVAAAVIEGEIANDDSCSSPITKFCTKGCTSTSCCVVDDASKEGGVNLDSNSKSVLFIIVSSED